MSETSSVVLLIEPDDETRAAYEAALCGGGFNVIPAASCEAARHTLDAMTPRLIIARFDVWTHDECLAFVERIKGDPRIRDVPILLTTEIITRDDLRATDLRVLRVAVGPRDGAKMAAVVGGVLTVTERRQSA